MQALLGVRERNLDTGCLQLVLTFGQATDKFPNFSDFLLPAHLAPALDQKNLDALSVCMMLLTPGFQE